MSAHNLDVRGVIDHTFLKTEEQGVSAADQERAVCQLVEEALSGKAFGICVYPRWVRYARGVAGHRKLPITAVVGFPVPANDSGQSVIEEIVFAREEGANEFDMVVQVEQLKQQHLAAFEEHIYNISQAAKTNVLKVIFENAYLSEPEKLLAYKLAKLAIEASWRDSSLTSQSAVRFFKTSTGFANVTNNTPIGATLEDVKLMARIGGSNIGIKPAGGVNSYEEAVSFWKAAGAPMDSHGHIDPYRFRIGSSSLLRLLNQPKE